MEFDDGEGNVYRFVESVDTPSIPSREPIWPWIVGGLALVGGLAWMASASSRRPNPIDPEIEGLIEEARNPATSQTRLEALLAHSEEVRRAILDNPNLCPTNEDGTLGTRLLEELSQHFPEEVASHPAFVLHAMIDFNFEMVVVVAHVSQRTSNIQLIEQLVSTWSWWWIVRLAVAMNQNTPECVLRTLVTPAFSLDTTILEAVARNPNTPEDLLRTLANPATERGLRRCWG